MSDATVSASYTKGLLDFAVSKGADRQALLVAAGINESQLVDRDNRIPYTAYVALMKAGKALTNMPELGLEFGAATEINELSITGMICYSCQTWGEALFQLNRFGRLVMEMDLHESQERFVMVEKDDGLWLEDKRQNPNSFIELTEDTMARFICTVSKEFNHQYYNEVHFTHSRPDYSEAYERVLQIPMTFNSHWNALRFDPALLGVGLENHRNFFAFGLLSEQAERLLKDLESRETIRSQVERQVMSILHKGDVSMDQIAQHLGMSRPTLYRKLKAEGITFESVLDGLRQTLAQHYLSSPKISINETAYLTGFSEASAFSRAFKRWTGQSPAQYRTQALE